MALHQKTTVHRLLVALALILAGFVSGCGDGSKPTPPVDPYAATRRVLVAKVTRTWIDTGSTYSAWSETHKPRSYYMVGTVEGVFEIDNLPRLRLYNADELFARIESGNTYSFEIVGEKILSRSRQQYPYIVAVRPAPSTTQPVE